MQRALKIATPAVRFTRNAGSVSYNRTPTTRRSILARNRSLATLSNEKQTLEERLTDSQREERSGPYVTAETGRATQVARAAGATVGLATMITGMAAYATVCGVFNVATRPFTK